MHKFHLGQLVEFNPPRGIYAPRGPYVVTAKLPGLGGVFEYRVRNANDNMTGRRWKMSCARSRLRMR